VRREEFWAIVGETREEAEQSRRPGERVIQSHLRTLKRRLMTLPDSDLLSFGVHLDRVRVEANSWDLWGAGYLALGGMSDDAFIDFRTWLISHGQEVYERVRADPDALAELAWDDDEEDFADAEEWGYLPDEVYEDRTGDEPAREGGDDQGASEPAGEPFPEDEGVLAVRYPRLASKLRR
jgi:hypothetical protein